VKKDKAGGRRAVSQVRLRPPKSLRACPLYLGFALWGRQNRAATRSSCPWAKTWSWDRLESDP